MSVPTPPPFDARLEAALDAELLGPFAFTVLPGRLPVLFTAPHAAAHPREGRLKAADRGTGSLALAAAAAAGAWGMAMLRTATYDPNWDPTDPFKEHVERLVRAGVVRAVVDVHGMRASDPEIELGTGGGTTLSDIEATSLHALLDGARVARDVRFCARHPGTVTQHAHAAGASAVQMELCPALRLEPAGRERILGQLVAIADYLASAAPGRGSGSR